MCSRTFVYRYSTSFPFRRNRSNERRIYNRGCNRSDVPSAYLQETLNISVGHISSAISSFVIFSSALRSSPYDSITAEGIKPCARAALCRSRGRLNETYPFPITFIVTISSTSTSTMNHRYLYHIYIARARNVCSENLLVHLSRLFARRFRPPRFLLLRFALYRSVSLVS